MTDLVRRAAAAQQAGRLEEAAALLRQALKAMPGNASLLNNLGGVLDQLGRLGEAIPCYRQGAEAAPEQAVPHFNLGEALLRDGKPADALAPLRAAATLDPDLQPAWATLGEALMAVGRPSAALAALRRACALKADDGPSHRRLGDALQMLGRYEEALPHYAEAARLDAGDAEAWYGRGRALLALERPAEAVPAFDRCLAAAPGHAAAWHDKGKALFQLGCVEAAMPLLRRAAAEGPPDVQSLAWESLAVVIPGSPADDNASILACRREWARRHPSRPAGPRPVRRANPRLRVGYVSAYFHRPNWMKPVWAVVNRHDRARFQVRLFGDVPGVVPLDGYSPQPGDETHNTSGMSNEEVAALIARQKIDVLIDLNGFSVPRRLALFALRPAPVQAGWFNLYATSGLPGLDTLIGDDHVIPQGEERFYTERIERVPGSYLTFEVSHAAPEFVPPPMLASGRVTIGCLASQYKITDDVVAAWCEILRGAPAAHLLLRNATLGRPESRAHLLARFAAGGVGPERLTLEGPAAHLEFLGTYGRIDFALDVFPYSGGTTTAEALWQGVPVVTFDPGRWAGRTSLSQLRAAGLEEFVAADRRGYVEMAVRLATSPDTAARLAALRSGMRSRLLGSPVCDAEALTRALEACYQRLWDGAGA